jgi:THAP4-like, heme-binding beta-barrel domain
VTIAIHPDVAPLAFLLGTWRGEGSGEYPTIDAFGYGEEMSFEHAGLAYLLYAERSWLLDEALTPVHFERGFVRPAGEGRVELVLAHPIGVVEIADGSVDGGRLDLRSIATFATPTGAPVRALRRRIEVDGDVLRYEMGMATDGVELSRHLRAELRRIG